MSTKTLGDKFKAEAALELQVAELKKENKALKDTVTKLLAEVDRLNGLDKKKLIKLEISPEQEIMDMQIMRLQAISRERLLSIDECRQLDLHVKNKRLLDDKSTINAEHKTLPAQISDAELLRIAESAQEETPVKKRNKSKTS